MTTRELIEAVRKPPLINYNMPMEVVTTSPVTTGKMTWLTQVVLAHDYNAMRAATVAVLDDLIPNCGACEGDGMIDRWPAPSEACPYCANARALRERLK